MGPSPELTMPVSAVVSLHSGSQRIPPKTPAIDIAAIYLPAISIKAIYRDLAGKKRVRMRSARKSDPSLVAQRNAKRGTPLQIPRNRVPINLQVPPAGILAHFVVANSEMKWILSSRAQIKTFKGKSLNEAQRFFIPRKPGGPNLDWHPARVTRAAAPSRIHQQISEPPGPDAVRQSQTNKPDFVTASGRER